MFGNKSCCLWYINACVRSAWRGELKIWTLTAAQIWINIWSDFDSASSLICGNKMPTRSNRWFLLQILLLAQHVSGTVMPIIRSSRVLYKRLLPVVFGALIFKLSVWCGAEGYVSGLRAAAAAKLHKMYQCRCTAKNSWWWTERLPETCKVVIPIKLEFSASVGFIHKEFLMMHGHTIIKKMVGDICVLLFMDFFLILSRLFKGSALIKSPVDFVVNTISNH